MTLSGVGLRRCWRSIYLVRHRRPVSVDVSKFHPLTNLTYRAKTWEFSSQMGKLYELCLSSGGWLGQPLQGLQDVAWSPPWVFPDPLSRFVGVRLPFQCQSFRHKEIVPGLGLFCGKVQADFFRKPTMALGPPRGFSQARLVL